MGNPLSEAKAAAQADHDYKTTRNPDGTVYLIRKSFPGYQENLKGFGGDDIAAAAGTTLDAVIKSDKTQRSGNE